MSTGPGNKLVESKMGAGPSPQGNAVKQREPDAIYQNGELVARVINPPN